MTKLPTPDAVHLLKLTPLQTLSPAELTVLKLAAAGRTEKESAEYLGNSYKTIKFHKTNIYKKLNVKNIVQAVLCLERDSTVTVNELNAKDYIAEFSRLNNLVQFLRDELETERSATIKYKLELERIQTGKKSEFKILPSDSTKAFNARITGVPK